jgi:hypothetical protein
VDVSLFFLVKPGCVISTVVENCWRNGINLAKRAARWQWQNGLTVHNLVSFLLTTKPKLFRLRGVKQSQIAEVMSWMGKRSYATRVQRFGIERIREIARQNGKKGGRPRKEQKTTKL